jgi:hypothetical protein
MKIAVAGLAAVVLASLAQADVTMSSVSVDFAADAQPSVVRARVRLDNSTLRLEASSVSVDGTIVGALGTTLATLQAQSTGFQAQIAALQAQNAALQAQVSALSSNATAPRAASQPFTCTTATRGALYFNTASDALQVCTATGWRATGTSNAAPGDGTTSSTAGTSCASILGAFPSSPTTMYWVDPDGAGSTYAPWQTLCDMSTGPGGWTLVAQAVPVSNAALTLCASGAVGTLDLTTFGTPAPAKLSNAAINALWATGSTYELLVKLDEESVATTRTAWDYVCSVNFKSTYSFNTAQPPSSSLAGDLDSTTMTCYVGAFSASNTFTNVNPNSSMCGYSLTDAVNTRYLSFSIDTTYSGGTCGSANAGRTWMTYGNFGCNAGKIFVR